MSKSSRKKKRVSKKQFLNSTDVVLSKKGTKRPGRSVGGHKTKYYKPYKPRVKKLNKDGSVKRNKPNRFLYFRSCLASYLRENPEILKQYEERIPLDVRGNLSKLAGYMWRNLTPGEKADVRRMCENMDWVWVSVFGEMVEQGKRHNDILGIRGEFDLVPWYLVRDDFHPGLVSSRFWKKGDKAFYSGIVGGKMVYNGEWLLMDNSERGFQNVFDFHEKGKMMYNNPVYKTIITYPKLNLDSIKENPDGSLYLFYVMIFETGDEQVASMFGLENIEPDDSIVWAPAEGGPVVIEEVPVVSGSLSDADKYRISKEVKTASLERMFAQKLITFNEYMEGLSKI